MTYIGIVTCLWPTSAWGTYLRVIQLHQWHICAISQVLCLLSPISRHGPGGIMQYWLCLSYAGWIQHDNINANLVFDTINEYNKSNNKKHTDVCVIWRIYIMYCFYRLLTHSNEFAFKSNIYRVKYLVECYLDVRCCNDICWCGPPPA